MKRPWSVLTGDCRTALFDMADESIDACVTDTPYGLSKLLDPANLDREALWLKLTSGQKEAPIKVLMRSWLDTGENPVMRGRGFMGKEWDALVPAPNTWSALWRVLKPGAAVLAFAGDRTSDLIAMSMRFADFEFEGTIAYLFGSGMPKRVRLDLKIDEHFGKKHERPVLGTRPQRANSSASKVPFNNAVGDVEVIHGAATPEAARFVGHDRALRPGFEPVLFMRKPCRGTIAQTALAYGTGGLHVDACRIPRGDVPTFSACKGRSGGIMGKDGPMRAAFIGDSRGGYPSNVIIDEETAALLDAQSGHLHSACNKNTSRSMFDGAKPHVGLPKYTQGHVQQYDTKGGGASRFFYTAKASTSERDKGLESLPPMTPGERCDREDGTDGISAYAGTRGDGGRNPGPCVKPLALMQHLVRLASPPGAWDPDIEARPTILDIFAGSGSTGVAALCEGVNVVLCELDPEMAHVARLRCQHAYALPREAGDAEGPPAGLRKGQQGSLL